MGNASVMTFGPIVEDALLSLLSALGVLHNPESDILILPLETAHLRNIVYNHYISKRGGHLAWHVKLIAFFTDKNVSPRRCEELPWHLTLCRKWYPLKDCVSDLATFHIMSQSSMRIELIRYWNLLTFGPLYVSDQAEQDDIIARQHKTENQFIISELDTSKALNLNEKEAKKQKLKGKVACFDVVDEFQKAVDLWVSVDYPSGKRIVNLLEHVARFMVDFGRTVYHNPPPFLRLGADVETLAVFGITHAKFGVTCVLGSGAAPICTSGGNGSMEKMSGQDVITDDMVSTSVFPTL
jgi:hypothetical protein